LMTRPQHFWHRPEQPNWLARGCNSVGLSKPQRSQKD
jgi:hypothetical protein